MADGGFSAFPAETVNFLRGIDRNNSKEWFEANRGLYEAGYVAAARDFITAVGPKLKVISPGVRYEPKINGSIMRINRDVRFSRDKRPYKNHLDISFWHGERKGWDQPAFYMRITPEEVFLGSGMHVLKDETLDQFRQAVLDERSGKALDAAVAKVRKAGPYEVGGATRKSVPRGFDASHERADYLLHEGLYAGLELPAEKATRQGFVDVALKHFAATWPIGRWLLDEIGR